jgi:hypothetical protein
MSLLYILPCSKTKIWDITTSPPEVPAHQVYKGQLFLKGKSIVHDNKGEFLILSAKYGFVEPQDMLSNYNVTFKTKKPDVEWLKTHLPAKYHTTSFVVVLGGSAYADVVRKVFTKSEIILPLYGLSIGRMLQALNNKRSMKERIRDLIEAANNTLTDKPWPPGSTPGCTHLKKLPTLEDLDRQGE